MRFESKNHLDHLLGTIGKLNEHEIYTPAANRTEEVFSCGSGSRIRQTTGHVVQGGGSYRLTRHMEQVGAAVAAEFGIGLFGHLGIQLNLYRQFDTQVAYRG